MERVRDASGNVVGYSLLSKRYRRRKPELRSGSIKWVDDKSARGELEDAATAEDQRRVDVAWRVVQSWLRHYDARLQGPPPAYDAVDANYYVTWAHFAQWLNALLEQTPAEVAALEAAISAPSASLSTPRRSPRSAREPECAPFATPHESTCT
jgi:hypothetical protein